MGGTRYRKGVNSQPGRAGDGRFCEGLGPGLVRDVDGGPAREMFCSCGLFSENVGHCDQENRVRVKYRHLCVLSISLAGWGETLNRFPSLRM